MQNSRLSHRCDLSRAVRRAGYAFAAAFFGLVGGPTWGRDPSDGEAIRKLVRQLASDSFRERTAAFDQLTKIGAPAMPILSQTVDDPKTHDPELRKLAFQILERHQSRWQAGKHVGPAVNVVAMYITPDCKQCLANCNGTIIEGATRGRPDHAIQIWEIPTGKLLRRIPLQIADKSHQVLHLDNRHLITSLHGRFRDPETRKFALWDLNEGKLVRWFEGHRDTVELLLVSPDGKLILSVGENGNDDGSTILWDRAGNDLKHFRSKEMRRPIRFTPDSRHILMFGTNGGLIRVYRLSGDVVSQWEVDGYPASVGFSKDGKRIICGMQKHVDNGKPPLFRSQGMPLEGRIEVREFPSGKLVRAVRAHEGEIRHVELTADGKRFVSASMDGDIRVCDIESGKELQRIHTRTPMLLTGRITPDGKQFLAGDSSNCIQVWELAK